MTKNKSKNILLLISSIIAITLFMQSIFIGIEVGDFIWEGFEIRESALKIHK